MSDFWTVRPLQSGEEEEACALVRRVFNIFVAPEYEPEGVQAFYRYADPQRMRRCAAGITSRCYSWTPCFRGGASPAL